MTKHQQLQNDAYALFSSQLNHWEFARNNFEHLNDVQKRRIDPTVQNGFFVQHNPGRIASATARVDPVSISNRPCFLCQENLPREQKWIRYATEYLILVNPYPIFPVHFTIAHEQHQDQLITGRMADMLQLARELDDFVIMYNGAQCGASAPDHFHFQAGIKGVLPVENEEGTGPPLQLPGSCELFALEHHARRALLLKGSDLDLILFWAEKIYEALHTMQTSIAEPMLNMLAIYNDGEWRICIFPRKAHRPWQYDASGTDKVILSPGVVDLAGLLITPRREDYQKMNIQLMEDIFRQVCIDDPDWHFLKDMLMNNW